MRPTQYVVSDRIDGHISDRVLIEDRSRDGTSWVIFCRGHTLAADGVWEYEPQPSSRTPDYIASNRYPTAEAARQVWLRHMGMVLESDL